MAVGTLAIKSADASKSFIVKFENVPASYFIIAVQCIWSSHKNTNINNPQKLKTRIKTSTC